MAELKPCPTELRLCPFCGGEAKLQNDTINFDPISSYIECSECHVKTEKFVISTTYSSDEMAIEAWNKRVTDGTD